MAKRLISGIFLLVLMMSILMPVNVFAGGSGGEPLISDAVGWGLVGAMVIIGIYAVYKMKHVESASNDQSKDNGKSCNWNGVNVSDFVTSQGDVIIAKF